MTTPQGKGHKALVVGAGIGGLASAICLAAAGHAVTVVEANASAGGRMRETQPGGLPVDSGPTVLTLAPIFEALFARCGERLDEHLQFDPLPVLARHAWSDGGRLDLYADQAQSRAAVAEFAGAREAAGFDRFCQDARGLFGGLEQRFMHAQRPGLLAFGARLGPIEAFRLRAGAPGRSLWTALGSYFRDPHLRQLFGRYATYVGASPYAAPAVLMLIAHVEMRGVYAVRGGMSRLAEALAALAQRQGVQFVFGQRVDALLMARGRVTGVRCADGSSLMADAVVFNGDPGALRTGLLGDAARAAVPAATGSAASLSALTFAWHARTADFPLAYHTVFFSADYAAEFDDLFQARRLPVNPTVYLCAQDRARADERAPTGPDSAVGGERLFAIINAPALAVSAGAQPTAYSEQSLDTARTAALALLTRCGLPLDILGEVRTAPGDFARLFPGTGGAIYGQACHGWRAPFARPSARSRLPGLYLAGGGIHPGPGVPMVALSGQLAADAIASDLKQALTT